MTINDSSFLSNQLFCQSAMNEREVSNESN